jgi:hypothetical protein
MARLMTMEPGKAPPPERGISMASLRTIAALTVISGAFVFGAVTDASAQAQWPTQAAPAPVASLNQGFARCPKAVDQYVDVMKQLISSASRARALADENPLLEPDAAYYEAELAATRKCAPAVATLTSVR